MIKKWELILQKDKDRDVTYGRKVLVEMLNDFKEQSEESCTIKLIGIPKNSVANLKFDFDNGTYFNILNLTITDDIVYTISKPDVHNYTDK